MSEFISFLLIGGVFFCVYMILRIVNNLVINNHKLKQQSTKDKTFIKEVQSMLREGVDYIEVADMIEKHLRGSGL